LRRHFFDLNAEDMGEERGEEDVRRI